MKKINPSRKTVTVKKALSSRKRKVSPALNTSNKFDDPIKTMSRAAWQNWQLMFNTKTSSGNIISEDNALEIDTVYACVRVLSESIAALPFELLRKTVKAKDANAQTQINIEKATEETLYDLLRWQPNPEMSAYEVMLWMMIDCLMRGRGVAQVVRDGRGRATEIWPLCANKLTPFRAPDNGRLLYKYQSTIGKDGEIILETNEVFTFQMHQYGGLIGWSLVQLQKEAIGASKAAETYSSEFFANGTALTGMLTVPEEMDETSYERLKKDWRSYHTGKGKRHGTPILEGGATYDPLALNHEESQLLETRKFQRSAIAGLFRVPSHLINDLEKASYNNIENVDIGFAKHTLRPWMVNIEQRARLTFLTPKDRGDLFFKFNDRDLVRGDWKSQAEGMARLIQVGVFSPNGVLEQLDMNTYEGGDIHLVNGALRNINEPSVPVTATSQNNTT